MEREALAGLSREHLVELVLALAAALVERRSALLQQQLDRTS